MKRALSYGSVAICGVVMALVYYVFIVKNGFAPAGLNGVATMIQYKTGFSISYMSLLINVPLSVLAYFFVQKEFALKTLVFSVTYSVSFLFLARLPFRFLQYDALGHDTVYPVILSGVVSGGVYGICFRNNASTGGTDVIARYINKVRPSANFFAVTFVLNGIVAVASVFVYSDGGLNYKPMALCVLYCFLSTFVGNEMLKRAKTAYKFTIITEETEPLVGEIIKKLRHSCTQIDAVGSYSGQKKSVVICIINMHQLNDLQTILARYENTFSYFEKVNETYGNFKKVKQ